MSIRRRMIRMSRRPKAVVVAKHTCRRYRDLISAATSRVPRYASIRFTFSFVFVCNGHAHVLQNNAAEQKSNATEQKSDTKRQFDASTVTKHLEETQLDTYVKSLEQKSLLHPNIWSRVRYLYLSLIHSVISISAHCPRSMRRTLRASPTTKAIPFRTHTKFTSWIMQKN